MSLFCILFLSIGPMLLPHLGFPLMCGRIAFLTLLSFGRPDFCNPGHSTKESGSFWLDLKLPGNHG